MGDRIEQASGMGHRAARRYLVRGPGDRDLVTPRAVDELHRASVVVGLDRYIEQIRDLLRPGTRVIARQTGTAGGAIASGTG
jgi:siroheme synthase